MAVEGEGEDMYAQDLFPKLVFRDSDAGFFVQDKQTKTTMWLEDWLAAGSESTVIKHSCPLGALTCEVLLSDIAYGASTFRWSVPPPSWPSSLASLALARGGARRRRGGIRT